MKRPLVIITILYALLILGANALGIKKEEPFDRFDGKPVTVFGIVSDIYTTDYGYQIVTVNTRNINEETYDKKLSARFKSPQNIQLGQSVKIIGIAEKLSFKRNIGGLSERQYMSVRGYGGKLDGAVLRESGEIENRYINFIGRFTDNLSASFYRWLPDDAAGIIEAMVLGDRTNLPEEAKDSFRETGAAYILTISGLNISCICYAVFYALSKLKTGMKTRAVLTIIIITVYCLLTGASVSTTRATIMSCIVLFAYIIERTPDVYSSLSLAAIVLLVKEPAFLWDAGFILSFSSVAGISFLTPVFEKSLSFLNIAHFGKYKVSGYLAANLAATVSVMPITLYYFGFTPFFGVIVSLLLLPFLSILIITGFLFLFLGSTPFSIILSSLIYTVLKYYMAVTSFFAKLPINRITTGQPSLYNVFFFYAILILICLYLGNTAKKRHLLITIAITTAIAVCINVYKREPDDNLEIAFLDVGQGDCTILHLPDYGAIMIDGGGNLLDEIGQSTGKKTVLPYLSSKGISYLNAVFLTHPDIDHAAGVIEIMSLIKVGRLFIPDCDYTNSGVMRLVLETAEKENIPVSKIRTGYVALINDVSINCVYPVYRGKPESTNSGSIVLKLTYKEQSFLFTGDIETADEFNIVYNESDIKCNVLKSPHHGSDTSSTPAFIELASPSIAIAGTGKNNNFGHPSEKTIELYNEKNIKLYNTANDGAVFIKTDGHALSVTTMKEKDE